MENQRTAIHTTAIIDWITRLISIPYAHLSFLLHHVNALSSEIADSRYIRAKEYALNTVHSAFQFNLFPQLLPTLDSAVHKYVRILVAT